MAVTLSDKCCTWTSKPEQFFIQKHPFPVSETVEFFRTYFGPTQRAFAVLPEDEQPALRRDLEALFSKHNRATDGTTWLEAEYLEVVAIKK
jgi:hypothetical protein